MDLLAVIHHADPTKVRIGEKHVGEGEVPLLKLTRGRAVSLADQIQEGDHVIQDEGADFVRIEDEVQAIVAKKPKVQKKRRIADGANGPNHPPNKLREDHDTSSYVGAGTGGKSLAIGVMVAATVPFITSFMTPTPERENDGPFDNISVANLGTQRQSKRDSSSPSTAEVDVAGPSQPAGIETSTDTFLASQDFDSALDDPEAFFGAEVRLRFKHNYTERKKFEKGCARLIGLLWEKDVEITIVEAVEAAHSSELGSFKEWNAALEGQVVALEFAIVIKDTELASSNAQIAKLT
nr:hypothetical protein [Tanacetum cinerariifolium]